MDATVPGTENVQVDRAAIISAANVLMVALLKMNRVLIPALLKWRRAARMSWISSVDDEIRRGGSRKRLPSRPDQVEGEEPPQDEEEHKMRVDREQFRRASAFNPLVYTSVVTVFFTILTIIIYSVVIITPVLSIYPFGPGQALIFSFSLVATATISEAETLLQKKKRQQSQQVPKKDISSFRPTAIDQEHARIQAGGGREGQADEENGLLETSNHQRPYGAMMFNLENADTEDFSDLE